MKVLEEGVSSLRNHVKDYNYTEFTCSVYLKRLQLVSNIRLNFEYDIKMLHHNLNMKNLTKP